MLPIEVLSSGRGSCWALYRTGIEVYALAGIIPGVRCACRSVAAGRLLILQWCWCLQNVAAEPCNAGMPRQKARREKSVRPSPMNALMPVSMRTG